jgi:hypothetical protein
MGVARSSCDRDHQTKEEPMPKTESQRFPCLAAITFITDIDFDAIKKKKLELDKKMQPAIKKVQDTVKGIVEAKKDAKAKK